MNDDIRERFLRAITAQVPADQIAEVHLFRPLRRGGTETGVAVIAAERADMVRVSDALSTLHSPLSTQPEVVVAETANPEPSDSETHTGTEPIADSAREEAADDSPYASETQSPERGDRMLADAATPGSDEESGDAATVDVPATPRDRHTVFTARYRLTLKGAERGKWEFDVVADADAPLGTVDTVVRGVLRRAGDEEEPERLTADGVRAALDGQSWRPTA